MDGEKSIITRENFSILEDLKVQKDQKEEILANPKRRPRWARIIVLILTLAIVFPFAWVGAEGLAAFKNISTKNLDRRSPFLNFLGSVDPQKLEGEGDGRINVLLLGMGGKGHPGGSLTDTIMVASMDPNNKEMAILSVPRDLYAPIPEHGYGKINSAHALGEQEEKGTGPSLAKEAVSQILDLPIHYFIRIDFDGFIKLVDAIGGLTVNIEKDIYDPYFPASNMIDYQPFYLKAGLTQMDGKLALKYVRSRKTTSDFDRSRRQQEFLTVFKDRAMRVGVLANPKKITEIMEIAGEHIKTDLSAWEIKRLIGIASEIEFDKTITKVLDNGNGGPLISSSDEAGYYLKPRTGNFKEIQRIAHEIFRDPYLEQEKANLEIINASGKKGAGGEVSAMLESYGYLIIKKNLSDDVISKTVIYDYTDGEKEYTLKFLKERFDAQIIKKKSDSDSNIEIGLALGKNYILEEEENE